MHIVWKKKVMTDEKILQQSDSTQVDSYQMDEPSLDKLKEELYVARQSQLNNETRKRYYGFFEQVQTRSIIAEWIEALLMLDSRQQLPQGIRSGNVVTSYRLHYAAEQAEIELLVEPQGQRRRIEGEVFSIDGEELGAALVQIQSLDSYEIVHETTSNENGRFRLENVNSDNCTMVVTPEAGPTIEIALELT